jgi:phage/plasmid-like protein (TIGR03299 family)
MAHNLETDANGEVSMFCTGKREAAWHLLGQRTPGAVTWEEAMKLAKLDWTVSKHPIESVNPITKVTQVLYKTYGIYRDTDGQYLGHVGKDYTPIQNRYAFDFVDALLEGTGAHYESAGALGHGERIWTMARLPQDLRIAGTNDVSENFLLFTNAHNGSASGTVKLTSTRVVCQNTLEGALSGSGASLMLRHTKEIKTRMEEAKTLMSGAIMDVEALEKKLNVLAERQMTKETTLAIIETLFPFSPDGKAQTRRERIILKVLELFESNDGNAIPEIRGSAYNFLNAITEYSDHYRVGLRKTEGQTIEAARANAAIFGSGNDLKNEAFDVITKVTQNNPTRGANITVAMSVAEDSSVAVMEEVETPAEETNRQAAIDAEVERILGL